MTKRFVFFGLLAITLLFLGTAQTRPTIYSGGVVNSASYSSLALPNSGIAQGSLFVVFGSYLGPAVLQQSGLPLGSTLAGTSMRVTPSGGTPVNALMFYSSAGQIAGILPSSTPAGDAALTVTYNNVTSTPVAIRVVPSNFGIFTRNQAGNGPAIIQNYNSATDQPVNSVLNPARPGQIMILWGTGLGPVDFDETVQPQAKDLPVATQVLVGGKSAAVLYHGRSPQFPGIDQVNFQLPNDTPLGCYVPVVVTTAGLAGNFGTIAVASTGDVCSDPHGLPGSEMARIRAGQRLNVGWIQATRLNIKISDYAGLGAVSGGADFGFGEFFRWDSTTMPASLGINAGLEVPMGTCMVQTGTSIGTLFGIGASRPDRITAGNALTLSGPAGTKSLARRGSGLYDKQPLGAWAPGLSLVPPSLSAFLEPGSFSVRNGTGSAAVSAFTAALTMPGPLVWSNAQNLSVVDRSQGVTVNWSGADASQEYVIVAGGVFLPELGPDTQTGALFACTERADAGRFTVPASVLSAIPAGSAANSTALLAVGRAALPASRTFTAQGLDDAYLVYMVMTVQDVVYR